MPGTVSAADTLRAAWQTGSWLLPRAVPQQGGLEHKLRIPSTLFSLPLVVCGAEALGSSPSPSTDIQEVTAYLHNTLGKRTSWTSGTYALGSLEADKISCVVVLCFHKLLCRLSPGSRLQRLSLSVSSGAPTRAVSLPARRAGGTRAPGSQPAEGTAGSSRGAETAAGRTGLGRGTGSGAADL